MSTTLSSLHRAISSQKAASRLNLIVFRTVDSTNRVAKSIAKEFTEEGLAPPTSIVVALEQEQGRGRYGRSWISPHLGGTYASIIVPFEERDFLRRLPLAIPVALCSAINQLLSGRCGLKWPNDLMVEDRKLGGVLVETHMKEEGSDTAIIGFGVNYHRVEGNPLAKEAITIEDLAERGPGLFEFTAALVESVVHTLEDLQRGQSFSDQYRELCIHQPGDLLGVQIGGRRVEGHFSGFTPEGFLKIQVGEELVVFPTVDILESIP